MSGTGDRAEHRFSPPGYTLIEALVVVAITTMAAMIGFPRMQQALLTLSERQTATVIGEVLRQARADAMLRDEPVIFVVDAHAYGEGEAGIRTPPGVTLSARQAPGGRIAFYGDGSSSGGQVIVHATGGIIRLTVAPLGGSVALRRG